MSVIFRIRPAGQLDGVTEPTIRTVVQDPATGIYDVTFDSLNSNFGVLDLQALFLKGLGNTVDDFLVAQLILTDGAGTTLSLSKDTYVGGAQAGINRALLWEFVGAPADIIGPKPFVNYTGQRLIIDSDTAASGESEIYVVAYPVSSKDLLDAICCTTDAETAAPCCAPQFLSADMFNAFAYTMAAFSASTLDLDASTCGQHPTLVAVIRPFLDNPGGTPPVVVLPLQVGTNIVRVAIDAALATDGRYVLELTNGCGCCYVHPITVLPPA